MTSAGAERVVGDAPTEEFMNVLNGSVVVVDNCIPPFDEPVHIEEIPDEEAEEDDEADVKL
jgi:hypothetical protein